MKALLYGVNPLGWATCRLLRRLWPGCLLSRLNGLCLRDVPPPELPADDWVRCRTVLGGICGSDLGILLQRQPPDSFLQSFSSLPAIMGHENLAVVDKLGSAVNPKWLGKRVCVDPALSCRPRGIEPPCRACAAGNFGACENFSADGEGRSGLPPGACLGFCAPVGGSWSESFVAHVSQLVEVPPELTDELAILTDPLACSLHCVGRADLAAAKNVLVYGAGILGLGAVWGLRAAGYDGRIDVIARHAHQAERADRLGASEVLCPPPDKRRRFELLAERTGGRVTRARFGSYMLSGGYDVVFECIGSRGTIEQALKWTRSRGQMVMVGMGHGRGADMTAIWFGELTVVGSSGRGEEDFRGRKIHTYRMAHELMLSGAAELRPLLTHTFALADYKAALKAAIDKGAHRSVKVAFRFARARGASPAEQGSPT